MRFLACALTALGAGLLITASALASPIVANGDFETGASSFTTYPGYVGGSNPAQVTDFAGPAGGYGINPGAEGSAPFRDNGNDNTNVLFVQAGGTTLTQTITGFDPGQPYRLDFDYNARGCCGGTAGITVSIGTGTFTDPLDTPVGGSNAYHHNEITFIADATSETLSISKFDAIAGDSTALFDNFTLIKVPEPSSLIALAGAGLLGCVAVAFRRKNGK